MLKFIYGPNNEIKGIDSGDNSFKTYSNHPMHTAEFFGVSSGQRGTDSTPAVGINISRGTISSPENTQPGDILATFAIRGKYND
jgi:hypothetical protein